MSDGDHISPWQPEQDRIRLAVLGKLIEECNELSARAARCIIHGLDETDPDSGRSNRFELQREVSDVLACIQTVESRLNISPDEVRAARKYEGFRRWHLMIEPANEPHIPQSIQPAATPATGGNTCG